MTRHKRRFREEREVPTGEHIPAHCTSIPLVVIDPRCLPSVAFALSLDGPTDSLYGYGGYMTTESFLKRFDHLVKHAPAKRPEVVIMDQHEPHILQPLDISILNPQVRFNLSLPF